MGPDADNSLAEDSQSHVSDSFRESVVLLNSRRRNTIRHHEKGGHHFLILRVAEDPATVTPLFKKAVFLVKILRFPIDNGQLELLINWYGQTM